MATLILPHITSQQPQQTAQIDWGNPLSQGLTSAFWGDNQLAVIAAPSATTGTRAVSKYGIGRKFNGTTDKIALVANSIPSAVCSRFVLVRVGGAASIATISGSGISSTGLRLNSASIEISKVLTSTLLTATSAVSANELCGIGMSSQINSHSIYKNGLLIASGITSSAGTDTANTPQIGARGDSSQFFDGEIYLHLSWNRILSAVEFSAISQNPWQVFKAPSRNYWVTASSAVNTAINPAVGSLAITGYSPSVAQSENQSLTPGAGSIALTGYAPLVSQTANQSLSPSVGSLSISGYVPSITQSANQAISPSIGQVAITGFAPSVVQASGSLNITPSTGPIVITGYAPSVVQSGTTGGGGSYWRVLTTPRPSKRAEQLAEILDDDDEEKTKAELLAKIKLANDKYYRALKTVPKAKQAEVFKEAWDLIKQRDMQRKDDEALMATLFDLF